MNNIYKRLKISKGNVYIVGDIHGEITQLKEALKEVEFDYNKDWLLCTGDLIDRGENSLACLELLKEPWFHTVKGNHEDMAYKEAIEKEYQGWIQNGGGWYYDLSERDRAYAYELIKYTAELPIVLDVKLKHKRIAICHADYPSEIYRYNKYVPVASLLWDRKVSKGLKIDNVDLGLLKGIDAIFYGHTPFKQVTKNYNRFYIDTGCGKGGKLTLIKINDCKD